MNQGTSIERRIGLFGALSIGVGAIVGGGILALAGVAFATTGPGAIVAFILNGMIAMLTALSFAEMSSKFPESGGTYTFAKKVVSVEAAFSIGWALWFASIIASVLYSLGLSYFVLLMSSDIFNLIMGQSPLWQADPILVMGLAILFTILLALGLMRHATSVGQIVNVTKVVVFTVLVFSGLWALSLQSSTETIADLSPFFPAGFSGLVQAMGYTFITFQGFDLIAAVGGEVKDPEKTIPRAMILSLVIALVIYLPLLFIIITVGTLGTQSIIAMAAKNPEAIVAIAAKNYLGSWGYWLVVVAAVLSMYSALQANLFAASRIARAMARDRMLNASLALINKSKGTPVYALTVTALIVILCIFFLPNISVAGSAASLIFLITFALAHGIAILLRKRSSQNPPPFRSPLFPAVPVIGGLSCIVLALFQGFNVPAAGLIVVIWSILGLIMFLTVFTRRAKRLDAARVAIQPELVTLRGRIPLVLVPVVNPKSVEPMVALAGLLVPSDIGRVLMLTVVKESENSNEENPSQLNEANLLISKLLSASNRVGTRIEVLTTVAPEPMNEIARVVSLHRCESVLLGFSEISTQLSQLERLLGIIDSDIVLLRAQNDWQLADTKKILVPVAGKGHDHLLARLVGSLLRTGDREVTFLRVLKTNAAASEIRQANQQLANLAEEELSYRCNIEVVQNDDAILEITRQSQDFDLLILGVQKVNRQQRLFGDVIQQIASNSTCPFIAICSR